jgi:hypothetical protein
VDVRAGLAIVEHLGAVRAAGRAELGQDVAGAGNAEIADIGKGLAGKDGRLLEPVTFLHRDVIVKSVTPAAKCSRRRPVA